MKKLGILLIMCLILALIIPISEAQLASRSVRLTFLSQDPDPVEPGEIVDLRFKIENYGDVGIENVNVELNPEYPFSIVEGEERIKNIGTLEPSQKGERGIIILWRVKVDPNAVAGDSEIEVQYSTKSGVGVKFEPFNIRVQSRESILAVKDVQINPENPSPGEDVEVSMSLVNLESTDVEDIRVKLNLDEVLASLGSTDEQIIPRIARGSSYELKFNLIVNPETKSKLYNIPLNIRYSDKFGEETTITTAFGMKVYSEPDYIISLANSDVRTAGSLGEVTIALSNVGVSDINFVTLELLPSEEYDIVSTKTVYLGNVESDDYETAEFNIFVKNPGKDRIANLMAKLSYKDSYNRPNEEIIEIPLEIYSSSIASRYGVAGTQGGFFSSLIFMLTFGVPLAAFWLFMLLDLLGRKMPKRLRRAWLIILILSNIVGAILYFFFGRKMGKR